MKKPSIKFRHNWVLSDKLLVGEAPHKKENINLLESYEIKSILCLCDEKEFPLNDQIETSFNFKRIVLPDHKHERTITLLEIEQAIMTLSKLLDEGKVYVHCFAGLERSPLICMGYLMFRKNLTLIESIEYVMSVNPGSCPMKKHLDRLDEYFSKG